MSVPEPTLSDVAIIIVNYKTADLAVLAVESVLAQNHGGHPVEIHLLDNNSGDADQALFKKAHQERNWGAKVTLWLEGTNHGFGRGNNVVLTALATRDRPPRYVFLLNPDAQVQNDAIALMADFMDAAPDVGAAGARSVDGDGHPSASAFLFPGLASEFEKTVNFGPITRLLKRYRVPLSPSRPAGPVDWVSGAAVMFRFEALQDVNFFDPSYFLYYEEVDLMRRLKARKWEVHFRPDAQILHVEGVSTQVHVHRRRPVYLYRSWRRYFSGDGHFYVLATAVSVMAGSAIGLVIATILRRPAQVPERFFRDHWHYVLAPLLGLRKDVEYEADTLRAKAGR